MDVTVDLKLLCYYLALLHTFSIVLDDFEVFPGILVFKKSLRLGLVGRIGYDRIGYVYYKITLSD